MLVGVGWVIVKCKEKEGVEEGSISLRQHSEIQTTWFWEGCYWELVGVCKAIRLSNTFSRIYSHSKTEVSPNQFPSNSPEQTCQRSAKNQIMTTTPVVDMNQWPRVCTSSRNRRHHASAQNVSKIRTKVLSPLPQGQQPGGPNPRLQPCPPKSARDPYLLIVWAGSSKKKRKRKKWGST